MEKPLISVIVPVYNVEKYIGRCLDSLMAQTYGNLEILLINDASTDGSGGLCDRYAAQDPRVRAVHLTENRGVSHARNVGLEEARGSFVAFVDPDDYVALNMLERLYGRLLEENAGICVCDVEYVGFRGEMPSAREDLTFVGSCQDLMLAMQKKEIFMGLGGTLCQAEAAKKCGFPEDIHVGEDKMFLYQMDRYVDRVARVPEKLYYYVFREDSASHRAFGERRCTEAKELAYFCGEAREKFPQMLPLMAAKVLHVNVGLAVEAVKSREITGRARYAYLKEFHRDVRRFFSADALAHLDRKKIAAEVILLYISPELFWGVTALYKWVKRRVTGRD